MNIPGVINLSQAAAKRVDAMVGAIVRLAAAVEANTAALDALYGQRDAEQNGPRG